LISKAEQSEFILLEFVHDVEEQSNQRRLSFETVVKGPLSLGSASVWKPPQICNPAGWVGEKSKVQPSKEK